MIPYYWDDEKNRFLPHPWHYVWLGSFAWYRWLVGGHWKFFDNCVWVRVKERDKDELLRIATEALRFYSKGWIQREVKTATHTGLEWWPLWTRRRDHGARAREALERIEGVVRVRVKEMES